MVESAEMEKKKVKRIAWGITGSGDRLIEVIEIMKQLKKQYQDDVRITVYLSKAGYQVVNFYNLANDLKKSFENVRVEVNSNIPTLAVQLQSGKIEFLLIAPTTANTVAKIVAGITDTLLTNATIMSLKSFVPIYVVPCDYKEGTAVTQLPDRSKMKLRVRKEDVERTKKLAAMDGIYVLEQPEEIRGVFQKHFKP
jgi:archaeoflavoprotein AfpA